MYQNNFNHQPTGLSQEGFSQDHETQSLRKKETTRLRDDPINWWLALYFIAGTIGFYLLALPIAHYFSQQFWDLNTNMIYFDNIYYRYYVHTKYLPLQQMAYYSLMMIMGFMFINLVNLTNSRKNPFKGSDGTYKDFRILLVLCFALFFTSGIVVLRQNEDLKSYCEQGHQREVIRDPIQTDINLNAPLHKIFMSIEKMNYGQRVAYTPPSPQCHEYTAQEVFHFNYFVWTLGFLLGLQFTHLDVGILQQFTLDWNVMKNWPWFLWVLFLGLITLLLSLTSYLLFLYAQINFLFIYFGVIGALVLFVYIHGKILGPTYHLHIHHYFLGMSVVILICYQNMVLSFAHAIFNGIMIEGGCRWGFSPLWENDNNCTPSAIRAKQNVLYFQQAQERENNSKIHGKQITKLYKKGASPKNKNNNSTVVIDESVLYSHSQNAPLIAHNGDGHVVDLHQFAYEYDESIKSTHRME
eukprot:403340585